MLRKPLTQGILARQPRDLTVVWAQRIVAHHVAGTTVLGIAVLSVESGTTTRVRLAVDHNGPETLPRRWFVKLPSQSWRARAITTLPRLLQREVRFYQEVAPAVPVPVPTVLAAQRLFGRGTTLVLADVTAEGARPGTPGEALTAAQATMVVDQLARLHGCFWNHASLDQAYRWLAGAARRWEDVLGTALAVPLMQRGLRHAGDAIPATLHTPAMGYARQRRHAMRVLAAGPRTLIHHDCHPGNLFWTHTFPGLLDWQLVRIGEGIGDVAYFLATALDPATRRQHETPLLARYQQGLAAQGVTGLDTTTLLHRYRAHLTYAFEAMVVTLAVGGMMERASNLELIRRAATAVEDHNAFMAILA
jgi:aminoglycoside phosphotransferase (APT) family kinase protein